MLQHDEVLKMAKQAQVHEELCGEHFIYEFAKLVDAKATAKEREACALIAETPISGEQDDITMEAKDRVAKAIRARSISRGEA